MLEFQLDVPNPIIRGAITALNVAVDQENRRVHLLDLDADTSLTNAINVDFQNKVLKEIGIKMRFLRDS